MTTRPGACGTSSISSRNVARHRRRQAARPTRTDSRRSTTGTTEIGSRITARPQKPSTHHLFAACTTSCSATRMATTRRPRFAAGTGLLLSAKLFFDYRGAIFWKMTAGMGEVVFAPLYEALGASRGAVRVLPPGRRLGLSDDGAGVDAVDLGVQAHVRDGETRTTHSCRSAVCHAGRPSPRREQLAEPDESRAGRPRVALVGAPDAGSSHSPARRRFRRRGARDPVGMHRYICSELIENPAHTGWHTMTKDSARSRPRRCSSG